VPKQHGQDRWELTEAMRILVHMQNGTALGIVLSPDPTNPQGHLTPTGPMPICIITMEEGSIWATRQEDGERILIVPRKESQKL